jgi:TonB family protein
VELGSIRRMATAAVCVLLGVGTCASALALRIKITAPAAPAAPRQAQSSQHPGAISVPATVVAGNLLTHVMPIYPDIARAAGISGEVVLHAIIGKSGTMQSLQAISGPEMLKGAAIEAVRQWTYRPYLLNGEPTEVDTTITVTFSINN